MPFPFLSPPSLQSLSTFFFFFFKFFLLFPSSSIIKQSITKSFPHLSHHTFFSALPKKSCILLPPSHLLLTFRGMGHLGLSPTTTTTTTLSLSLSHIHSCSFVFCQLQSVQLCSLCQNKLWNLISLILWLSLPWEFKIR